MVQKPLQLHATVNNINILVILFCAIPHYSKKPKCTIILCTVAKRPKRELLDEFKSNLNLFFLKPFLVKEEHFLLVVEI